MQLINNCKEDALEAVGVTHIVDATLPQLKELRDLLVKWRAEHRRENFTGMWGLSTKDHMAWTGRHMDLDFYEALQTDIATVRKLIVEEVAALKAAYARQYKLPLRRPSKRAA